MSGVRLSRAYMPAMVKHNWRRVVFLSSESALNPLRPHQDSSPGKQSDAPSTANTVSRSNGKPHFGDHR
jgi:hypothetical protein